jgi:hypothetical protein
MRHGGWLPVALLLGVVGLLAPLAAASPQDPVWMPGLWDSGAFDDAIVLVASSPAVVHAAGFADRPPSEIVGHLPLRPSGRAGDTRLLARDRTRAPPLVLFPFE